MHNPCTALLSGMFPGVTLAADMRQVDAGM